MPEDAFKEKFKGSLVRVSCRVFQARNVSFIDSRVVTDFEANEGKEWTEKDDHQLLELVK